MEMTDMMSKRLAALSKYECLGVAIPAKQMIGFWFGVGVMLTVGVVNSLNHFIGALMKGK